MAWMADWFFADERKMRGDLLFLLGAQIGKKDEVAVGVD